MNRMEKEKLIGEFASMIPWARSLEAVREDLWLMPLAEGKWSMGEILAHLLYWDRFLWMERVPHIRPGADLSRRRGTEALNREASRYARSGVPKATIIHGWVDIRSKIVKWLHGKPDPILGQCFSSTEKGSHWRSMSAD